MSQSLNNFLITVSGDSIGGTFNIPYTKIKTTGGNPSVSTVTLKQGNKTIPHFSKDESTEFKTIEITSKASDQLKAIVRRLENAKDPFSVVTNNNDNDAEAYSQMTLQDKVEFESGDSDVSIIFAGL